MELQRTDSDQQNSSSMAEANSMVTVMEGQHGGITQVIAKG